MEEIYVSVAEAAKVLATTRWSVWKKLRNGDLEAQKDGRRTKITVESIKKHAASLPVAEFGTRRIAVSPEPEPTPKRRYRRRVLRAEA
jgi:excisionase family DNA binding protein